MKVIGCYKMKDEYILYLDESEFKASKTFAIAGIAIKRWYTKVRAEIR